MPDKCWKRRERQVAEYFGVFRTPLSGKNSRHGAGDIIHPSLTVEHKHRKVHAVIHIWDSIKHDAKAENKVPVVTLSVKGRKGFWVLCHCDDLVEIANERRNAALEI